MAKHKAKLKALMAYHEGLLSEVSTAYIEKHLAECETCSAALEDIKRYSSLLVIAQSQEPTFDASRIEFAIAREARHAAAAIRDGAMDFAPEMLESVEETKAVEEFLPVVPKSDAQAVEELLPVVPRPAVPQAAESRAAERRRKLAQGRGSTTKWIWGGFLVAACALLAFNLWARGAQETEVAELVEPLGTSEEPVVQEIPSEQGSEQGTVVATLGAQAVAHRLEEEAPLAVGDAVAVSDRIETGAGTLHATLTERAGIIVHPHSELEVRGLSPESTELLLERGRVTNDVTTGTIYYVDAPPYRVRVQGTRFEVNRNGDEVSVVLDEGMVEIINGDEVVAQMQAPDRWSSTGDFEGASENGEVAHPMRTTDGSSVLSVVDATNVREWLIGGVLFEGGMPISIAMPPGHLEIGGRDTRGQPFVHELELGEAGTVLDVSEIDFAAVRAAGNLDAEVIAAAIRPSRRRMQRCYERELRQNDPELAGEYRIRVSLDRSGAIRNVRVLTQDSLPPTLRHCLEQTARQWVFPPPGGPFRFETPVRLSAR